MSAIFPRSWATGSSTTPPAAAPRPPFASAYGLHVVRVERRVEGRDATLAEVRSKVRADLLADRERASQRRFVTRLERRFGVRYDAAAKAHLGFDLPATKTRLASAPAAVGAAVAR